MGTGFSKKKKQAKLMHEQLSKMHGQMESKEVTGTAGNGLVFLVLTGNYEMKQLKIKPECVDVEDLEGLEDLIKAAYRDALEKLHKESDHQMGNLQGMPGFPHLQF